MPLINRQEDVIFFPHLEILSTENFTVTQDREVPIAGFCIISSKKSINSIIQMNEIELREFIFLVKRVRDAMKASLDIQTVYMFQNEDSIHGYHLWLFPRHPWMDRFGKKIESVRPIMNYAKETMISNDNVSYVKRSAYILRDYLNFYKNKL